MSRSLSNKPQSLNFTLPTLLLALGIVLCFASLYASDVEAHTEGKMQLAAEPAGPYKFTVWTSPDPAEVGELHIAVVIILAEDASPVLGANVLVDLTPVNEGVVGMSGTATAEDATNKFLYEAVFDVKEQGTYKVDLEATGDDGQSGNASFQLEVTSSSVFKWWLLIPVGIGFMIVVYLMFFRNQGAKNREMADQ